MRVFSPDACGATRRHQRIHACAECHGARVLNCKRPQGTRALQYCEWKPIRNIGQPFAILCFSRVWRLIYVEFLRLLTLRDSSDSLRLPSIHSSAFFKEFLLGGQTQTFFIKTRKIFDVKVCQKPEGKVL